jgi:hypothetical protein
MRIIAAELANAPENHTEVEVGMLPLDLDLPAPRPGMSDYRRTVNVRLTLHTSRGDLTVTQKVRLREEDPRQGEPAHPDDLPSDQHEALTASVEQRPMSGGDDPPGLGARPARLPVAPSDHAMAVFPIA